MGINFCNASWCRGFRPLFIVLSQHITVDFTPALTLGAILLLAIKNIPHCSTLSGAMQGKLCVVQTRVYAAKSRVDVENTH